MAKTALTGGFYKAKSVIAGAQRCANLYPEKNAEDSPFPYTYYLTPGLTPLATLPTSGCRGLYTAGNGTLYGVFGSVLYAIGPTWAATPIQTLSTSTGPVSMSDNLLVLVVVDGSAVSYRVSLTSGGSTQIVDPAFYGADRVDYLNTFLLFNRPGTNQFYISPSEWDGSTAFDPLDLAAITGASDLLQSLVVVHREIWLLGVRKASEIWYDAGAADFTFEAMPGVFIEHGCVAKYTVAKSDIAAFWLGQDKDGGTVVFMGAQYQAKRISTHALEYEIQAYGDVTDATGWTYQQDGHTFYVLTFPSADRTWVYDLATDLWHERSWTDNDGQEHRIRAAFGAYAYGKTVAGDWETGALYLVDQTAFTDAGQPIVRRRGFPHMVADGDRVLYRQFIAEMEVGTAEGTTPDTEPQVSLRWSDTRGASWGTPILLGVGEGGNYLRQMQVQQLGYARDRVFELFWDGDYKTALNGAWIDATKAGT